jgi:hypothetical protein
MTDLPVQMYCTVTRIDPSRGMAVRIAFPTKEYEDRFTKLVERVSVETSR